MSSIDRTIDVANNNTILALKRQIRDLKKELKKSVKDAKKSWNQSISLRKKTRSNSYRSKSAIPQETSSIASNSEKNESSDGRKHSMISSAKGSKGD